MAGRNLPQLYRFCYLITGDPAKAQEVFQDTVREAAFHSANGEPPPDRYWFFKEARWRCQALAAREPPAEHLEHDTAQISPGARAQIEQLEIEQLASWISAAPEPQRSAMALFYVNQFSYREIMSILDLKLGPLATVLDQGRREFQAWMNNVVPVE